jgi:iron complex transport system substrate-binding protein
MAAFPRSDSPRLGAFARLAFAIAAVLSIAGCAAGAVPTSSPSTGAASSLPPPITPTATPAAFPVTLTDDEGTTVTLTAEPQKIVSLTPATTEILFAIGAGSRVVATTDFDDYPPEAVALPDVASYTAVDVEKIVGLGADLVIAGGNGFNPPESITKLRSLNVPVVVTYGSNVDGVLKDIRLVGTASGEAAAADELATTMSGQFDAVRTATAGVAHPKVFYEIDATVKIYTAAKDSFIEEMLVIAGAEPITTGSTTAYDIPLETLVAADPTLILLGDAAYGVTPDQVKARPGWAGISAVKTGSIIGVNDLVITRPGPRLVQGLVELVHAIHPELVLPSSVPTLPPPSAPPGPPAS